KLVLFLAIGLRGWLVGASVALVAFSVAGVPPSAGFFGKLDIFRASVADGRNALIVLVIVGGALSLVYMFQFYQHRFWMNGGDEDVSPLSSRLLVLGLAVAIVAIGFWPEPLLALSARAA